MRSLLVELAEMSNIYSIEPKKIAILVRVFRLMDLVLNF